MNVSAWSIRQPIPSVLLFVLLTFAGLLGFRAMKVQGMPDVELPVVNVALTMPGAGPVQLETEVVRKVENAIVSVPGLKNTTATIVDGGAVVSAEFRLEKDIQAATEEVRDAVARVRSDLPADLREPVVTKLDLAGMPTLTYTVASDRMDPEALSWFVDDTVGRALLAARGVGRVVRVGGVTREIRVELDAERLLSLGVSALDISRQLRQVQQDAPAGRAQLGGGEQTMRAVGTVTSARDLAALEIGLSGGRQGRLSDLATVVDTVAEPRSAALLNGKPVVAFEVSRSRGAGEIEVAAAVRQTLKALQAAHPDVVFTEAFNFVDPTQENFDSSMMLLYEGALLAVLVVWFFLREWRATVVAAVALPMSAIPTFALMYLMGFSLNGVTLLALSLVVGVLVDDAIVEIENIMRHLREGKSPYQAAMEAADEIGLAVIATTFTLVAVFLPTAFMNGVVGRYFVQFGWTAAVAVWFSLVVARLLTPMMAAYMLRPVAAHDRSHRAPFWLAGYLGLTAWCLRHRRVTALTTLLFVGAAIGLVPLLGTGFVPPDDLSQTQVTITLPPGATLRQTQALAERARLTVAKLPHVVSIYTAIGAGSAGSDAFGAQGLSEVRRATLTIYLTPRQQRRGISKQAIENRMREALADLPGARVRVGLGTGSDRYIMVLSGDDGATLSEHVQRVESELRALPGVSGLSSSASLLRDELVVRPDPDRAADLGVTTAAIADTLRVATAGDTDQALAKLNLGQRQVPVVVRLPAEAREHLALLERLPVPGAHGPVALGNVARLALESGPAQIDRRNRLRNVNIELDLNGLSLGEVEQRVSALPSLAALPPGIVRSSVGDAEVMGELFLGFAIAMSAGVVCIYMVLVLLFRDFIQPVSIVAALVLAVPGALLALLMTGRDISMPSLIGMIMLMGIAAKNSILLVDYMVIARRDRGLGRFEAVMDACSKRARPVIMTTVAMAAGMLPAALGFGSDPSFRAPMAVVVVGGLLTSTVMSLLVVPVLYTMVDDFVQLCRRYTRLSRAPWV